MVAKKVELITLQRVPNYGSVLQAYATQKIIEKNGLECEIINYFPKRMTISAMLRRIKNKNKKLKKSLLLRTVARIIIFPSYIKRFLRFNSFYKNLNMTDIEYHSNDELKKNPPNADIYCTGSDQVWNSEWNEEIDCAMFLDFVPNSKKKIAISASFGKIKLDDNEVEKTRIMLEKYSRISLREKSGVDILKNIGMMNSESILDPTLLLTKEEWNIIASKKFKNEKYILVYNLNRNSKIDKYASNLSKKTGIKIKYLSYQMHEFYKKGKMYCSPTVEDFLSLIKNAEYVITDSFHGTAFSLNFEKEFVIVYPQKYSTRIQSILELLNLKNRVAKDAYDMDLCEKKIDYEKVRKKLSKERRKSLLWIKESLNNSDI